MSKPARAADPGDGRLKLFILAGEPSGDRIAADLVARLQQRVPLAFSGVGGHELEALGLREGGFGIMMSKGLVDEMEYNEAGNEVRLAKYLSPRPIGGA